MKLTKFAFTAMVAALAVWTSSAQIIPGGTYRFEKVNFSLVVRQQGLLNSNSAPATQVSTIRTMRITNKDLLNFLADAFQTEWPAGARLALLSNTTGVFANRKDIYVVDKTGTYPLWNASVGTYDGTNGAFFRIVCGYPVTSGKVVWGWPTASQNTTYRHIISFQLYRSDDADPSVYTDLNFQGLNTEKYREKMTGYTNRISISDKADLNGDGDMNDVWTVVSGRVTVAGKWKDIF